MKKRYLKVMFGKTSGANNRFQYKIDEVNITDNWNPKALSPKEMGGFNFSIENKILRWLVRGDTIYDVEIPEDAEIIDCESESAPHGVFRSNKIIISNPRIVTDDMAMQFYLKSELPEKSYFKAMAGCAVRGYIKTALKILEDKVNSNNIDLALAEFKSFCTYNDNEIFNENELEDDIKKVYELLLNIKNEV